MFDIHSGSLTQDGASGTVAPKNRRRTAWGPRTELLLPERLMTKKERLALMDDAQAIYSSPHD
jgi:hypothetical protein